MNRHSLTTLLDYVFKDLAFFSRVFVLGHWTWQDTRFEPGSTVGVTFYLERMAKKDIRQVEKLNGVQLLEGITLATDAQPVSLYKETYKQELDRGIAKVRAYTVLRDDFAEFTWHLSREEVITLLDYVLSSLTLPPQCAVLIFNCFPKGKGIACFETLEVLFVFPVADPKLKREAKKLQGLKLLEEVEINVTCIDYPTYRKFLSGEWNPYDPETRDSSIVLYDAFRGKRLKADFMKKISPTFNSKTK